MRAVGIKHRNGTDRLEAEQVTPQNLAMKAAAHTDMEPYNAYRNLQNIQQILYIPPGKGMA